MHASEESLQAGASDRERIGPCFHGHADERCRDCRGAPMRGLLYWADALVEGECPQPIRRARHSGLDGCRPEQCAPVCARQRGRCTDRCHVNKCGRDDCRRNNAPKAPADVPSRRRLLLLFALRGSCRNLPGERCRDGKQPRDTASPPCSTHLRFASLPPSAIFTPVVRG